MAHPLNDPTKALQGASLPSSAQKGGDEEITVDQALKMIQEMEKMHDKIEKAMSDVLERTGWSPKYLKTYLENPNNFSSNQEWEEMQKKRKELRAAVNSDKQAQQEGSRQKSVFEEGSHDLKAAKERRSKIAGQRRNWLPMR